MRSMLPPYRHDHAPDAPSDGMSAPPRARNGGVIGGVLAAIFLNFATISLAHADNGRTVTILVEGPGGEAVADGIAAHIEQPNSVRPAQPLRAALAARGSRTLAPAAANAARSAQLVARAHAAAVQAGVDVAVLVSMRKVHGAIKMHVWVIDAQGEGAWADKDVNPASATPDSEADAVWNTVSGVFEATKTGGPSAEPRKTARKRKAGGEPSPEVTAAAPVATPPVAPQQEGKGRASTLFVAQASVAGGARHFTYNQRLTDQLRNYDLTVVPLASLELELYPLVGTGIPFVRGLGVTGSYSRAIGLSSTESGGVQVATTWQNLDIGVRDRIHLDDNSLLGIGLGYGQIDFAFDQAANVPGVLPSVGYKFLHGGADLRLFFGDISVFGGAQYLYALSAGNIGTLFPHAQLGGVAAQLGAAYAIGQHFEVSLSANYTRFYYSFNPVMGDKNIAGGAIDELEQLSLGLGYLL
jgi:hypothetical protein